ncbi:hypothetical protein J437_LFUL004219 [Ladona fulva]|uniref:EGF-like domain-containing protein n=1 Tax=Ladona fulva TaxID=123851 RepID=A0A8K0JY50_LADFU|nr:hypothetical protein J437_LFUL004219 [Ladona fulva]
MCRNCFLRRMAAALTCASAPVVGGVSTARRPRRGRALICHVATAPPVSKETSPRPPPRRKSWSSAATSASVLRATAATTARGGWTLARKRLALMVSLFSLFEQFPTNGSGSCRSRANGTGVVFDCVCPAGFTGSLCEIGGPPTPPRTPCDALASASCLNGATCVVDNTRRGFHCSCVPGYAGTSCESPVDYCAAARPCANGGRCFSLLNDYKCSCKAGFVGKDCSIRRAPDLPENGRWAAGNVSRQVAEDAGDSGLMADSSQLGVEDAPLSTGHVVVIATLSTAVPAAALAAAAVVALAKRRRKRERRRADEEARMQNERNAGVFGAEKRQKAPTPPAGGPLLRDAHMIRNTWGFPEDAKNRHKCVNSVIVVEDVPPPHADVSANASVVSSVSDLCYALQRAAAIAQSAGHKQLNTEHRGAQGGAVLGGAVLGGSCGGKSVEKDFDNLRSASRVSMEKRVSVLSRSLEEVLGEGSIAVRRWRSCVRDWGAPSRGRINAGHRGLSRSQATWCVAPKTKDNGHSLQLYQWEMSSAK